MSSDTNSRFRSARNSPVRNIIEGKQMAVSQPSSPSLSPSSSFQCSVQKIMAANAANEIVVEAFKKSEATLKRTYGIEVENCFADSFGKTYKESRDAIIAELGNALISGLDEQAMPALSKIRSGTNMVLKRDGLTLTAAESAVWLEESRKSNKSTGKIDTNQLSLESIFITSYAELVEGITKVLYKQSGEVEPIINIDNPDKSTCIQFTQFGTSNKNMSKAIGYVGDLCQKVIKKVMEHPDYQECLVGKENSHQDKLLASEKSVISK